MAPENIYDHTTTSLSGPEILGPRSAGGMESGSEPGAETAGLSGASCSCVPRSLRAVALNPRLHRSKAKASRKGSHPCDVSKHHEFDCEVVSHSLFVTRYCVFFTYQMRRWSRIRNLCHVRWLAEQ